MWALTDSLSRIRTLWVLLSSVYLTVAHWLVFFSQQVSIILFFNATPWICVLTVWVFWPPGIKKVWTVGFYFLPPFSRLRLSFIAIIKQPWKWEHAWTQSNWTVVPGGLYLLCNSESFGYPEVQLWQQDCFSTFLLILLHIQIVGCGSTSHLAWVGMLGGQQKGMNDSFFCIL